MIETNSGTSNPVRLLNISEVAQVLGVTPKTIYSWVHTRQIPYVKVGRLVKFDRKDIEAWIQARKVPIMEY